MMDALLNLMPVLPAAAAMRWAMPVFWCVLAVWLVVDGLGLARRLPKPAGVWVAVGVAAWALVPGGWSLAYGLGLAFQLPSLVAVVSCAAVLAAGLLRPRAAQVWLAEAGGAPVVVLLWLGTALGWLLLLDTFALLPIHLYALGYSVGALAAVAACAALLWVWAGNTLPGLVLLVALSFYVALRLPTGNVFDALLDPWLWAWIQFSLLRRLLPGLKRPGL
jgi:hypothetical protein